MNVRTCTEPSSVKSWLHLKCLSVITPLQSQSPLKAKAVNALISAVSPYHLVLVI